MTNDAQMIAAARADAARTMSYNGGPPDPAAELREQVSRLSLWAPSANTAAVLVEMGYSVVAIDRDSLTRCSDPMAAVPEVLAHWSGSAADGVGLLGGRQRNGEVLVGLRTSPHGWREWLRTHGQVVERWSDDDGRAVERVNNLPLGSPVYLRWEAPPMQARTITSFGAAQIREHTAALQHSAEKLVERSEVMAPWALGVVYTLPAGEALQFRSKRLQPGVELLGEGAILPWHLRRPDGWTLTATRLPIAVTDGTPEWLPAVLGAKVGR